MTNTELAKGELSKFISDLEEKCNYNKIEIFSDHDGLVYARKYFYDDNHSLSSVDVRIDVTLF